MKQNEPARDEASPRDPLLEAAFTHFVQQAQAPAEFASRVRARMALLGPEEQPGGWRRRIVTWVRGAGVLRWVLGTDGLEALQQTRPWPGRGRLVVLVTCLVLSVLGNVWLGMRLAGQAGAVYHTLSEQETRGNIRLAFADDVREQDRTQFLLSLGATVVAGPSMQGVYTVLVPLPQLYGSPSSPGPSDTADSLRLLLAELRAHPYVRRAEPVSSP
jgi:hypothetical protein